MYDAFRCSIFAVNNSHILCEVLFEVQAIMVYGVLSAVLNALEDVM